MNTSRNVTVVEEMLVPLESGSELQGDLVVPEHATGLVLFAHGSGSSRRSSRNRYVARLLNNIGLATLLIDLLTASEEQHDLKTRAYRFDISLLTDRLVEIIDWIIVNENTEGLKIGLFGASTGAAGAINAASRRDKWVNAIVSRGGRPDLANSEALAEVSSPTLFIVGQRDYEVIPLNETAMAQMNCKTKLIIVPGATHLFEEEGALDQVASEASAWFTTYLK